MGLDFGDNPFDPGGPPDFFSGIIDAIISALIWLVNVIISVIVWIWNLLVTLVKILVTVFQTIGKFLLHVWTNYIKPAINWLADHIQKLRAWLKRVLNPVVKFFQKLKHWYDTHILAQQLRLLAIIQKIRRVLAIFRIFHFKWASALDQALADVQQRIQQSISIVRGILNQIITTLALVLDPTLFIARNVLGGTLLGNLGALKRIVGYGDNRIISASEVATMDHDRTRYFTANVNTHVQTLLSTGLTDEDKAMRQEFQKALAEATGQT